MECKITFSLILESLVGDIGDDWKYSVRAEVLNPGPTGAGTINVPEHRLTPGTSQLPPGVGQIVIPAGACGTGPRVKLTLNATEVDFLIDDKGSNTITVPMECPGPGGGTFTLAPDPEIQVSVRESPGILGGAATLKVKVRLVAACV
jgi:hypothetical protein